MTLFTQLYVFPAALDLHQQLEWLQNEVDLRLRPLFSSADLTLVNGDVTENTITPLPIERVRQLQVEVLQAPLQHDRRLIVLFNLDSASIPAQNSLLKLLEEPPAHVQILLTTHRLPLILETVQSRSQIISLLPDKNLIEQNGIEHDQKISSMIKEYPSKQLLFTEIFKISEQYKERDQALKLMRDITIMLHQLLQTQPTTHQVTWLKQALLTTQRLEKNVNARLAIEDFLLQFSNGELSGQNA